MGEDRIAEWLEQSGADRPSFPAPAAPARARSQHVVDGELNAPGVAVLSDLGDGVALFEIATKMNVFTEEVFAAAERAIDIVGRRYKALVLTGSGERAFSAGANLQRMRDLTESGDWDSIDRFIASGQTTMQANSRTRPQAAVKQSVHCIGGHGCSCSAHLTTSWYASVLQHNAGHLARRSCGRGARYWKDMACTKVPVVV